jgi:fructokinase
VAILCLGEAIVDLVCEGEADSIGDAQSFAPHFGGALANVSVAAAREGAAVELAGGVGDDPWGDWLRDRLIAEGVGLRWFSSVPRLKTPLAFITFDREREPSYLVYGDGIEAGLESVGDRAAAAVSGASALVFGSNTLVSETESAVTLAARAAALESGVPVVFDPNPREHRWSDRERMTRVCREMCQQATVVRTNRAEAMLIAGLPPGGDPREGAAALCELGARAAVVTLGAGGAVSAGPVEAEVAAHAVEVVAPLGAGDAFLGAMCALLDANGWDLAQLVAAMETGAAAGARACTSWGAIG